MKLLISPACFLKWSLKMFELCDFLPNPPKSGSTSLLSWWISSFRNAMDMLVKAHRSDEIWLLTSYCNYLFLDIEDLIIRVIIVGVILTFRSLTQEALETVRLYLVTFIRIKLNVSKNFPKTISDYACLDVMFSTDRIYIYLYILYYIPNKYLSNIYD